MKAKTKKGIKYTLLSALVALVGTVTIAASNPDFALGRNIQILFNMFRELNLLYVDQIDPDEMLLDAADGMTSKLDPYTELIPEKEMADFEIMTTGKYGGSHRDPRARRHLRQWMDRRTQRHRDLRHYALHARPRRYSHECRIQLPWRAHHDAL